MAELIWVDYAILAIMAVSALVSLVRGFVKEGISLLGWIAAFWLAITFTADVATLLEPHISVPSLRQGVAFAALFVAALLASGLAIYLVGMLAEKTGLSGTDRILGVLFGLGRGAVIVALLVLLAGFTELPRDPWWHQSVFIPHFHALAEQIQSLLPQEVSQQFQFGAGA